MKRANALIIATLMLITAGCSSTPAATTQPTAAPQTAAPSAVATASPSPSQVSVNLYSKPSSMNAFKLATGADHLVMQLAYDNLVALDDQATIAPRLAESYDIAPDAKSITFHLRQGLNWSDGQPFTSDDALFSFQMYSNADASIYAAGLKGVTFTAPDPQTFVMTLETPNAAFLAKFNSGYFIMPKHILGTTAPADMDKAPFWSTPNVTVGPFVFVQQQVDQFIEVAKNPTHYKPVKLDRVFIKALTTDVATTQLQSGELDLAQLAPVDVDRMKALPNIAVSITNAPNPIVLHMNETQAYFQDKRVRQAFMYGIDRKKIAATVLNGLADVPLTVPFGPPWAVAPSGLNPYDYDATKAKQLLADANWDPNTTVKLDLIAGPKDREAVLTAIAGYLNQIGVKTELRVREQGPTLADLGTDTGWDTFMGGGYEGTTEPDLSFPALDCKNFYKGDTGTNTSRYCNQRIQDLYTQGRTIGDQAQRAPLYQEVGQIFNDEIPYIPVYVPKTIFASTSHLQGFKVHPKFAMAFWNAADWSAGA